MKTALVTGASSGIGRDIARELSRRGWRVLLAARRKERLQELAEELPNPARVYVCDLAKEKDCYWLHERAKEQSVSLLVNAAGFGLYGDFLHTSLDRELRMIDVNVRAVHILTKLFVKDFVQRGEGRILNVASAAGFLPGPLLSTYYATKNYVVRLSEAIAEELRSTDSDVTISCLCPGPVDTEFNQVAGAKFGVKPKSSAEVAQIAVRDTLRGKLLIVPGWSTRLGLTAGRLVPDQQMLRIVKLIQELKG
jgi:hypothetical protein